mmetsp:Transcript_3862/g.6420  ORF Transcript_3862/g.6420 Transcript_3862/m.6420 type:complete len:134 (+) Transcript_3862:39-440(+)
MQAVVLALVLGGTESLHMTSQGRRTAMVRMGRSRFEDGDDRRLSQGGSGGRFGKIARRVGISGTEAFGTSDIRKARLEAYVNSDEEAADPLIGKIIAGSFLVTLFGLLYAVFAYYGVDGLNAATMTQRSIRGI